MNFCGVVCHAKLMLSYMHQISITLPLISPHKICTMNQRVDKECIMCEALHVYGVQIRSRIFISSEFTRKLFYFFFFFFFFDTLLDERALGFLPAV